jgi:hypothetical protein
VDVVKNIFNKTLIDLRNYCEEPIEDEENDGLPDRSRTTQYLENISCCDRCCNSPQDVQDTRVDIDFQTSLTEFSEKGKSFQPRLKKHRLFEDRSKLPSFNKTYTIKNLNPFTHYSFYIHACSSDYLCGGFEFHSEMTKPTFKLDFDRVKVRTTKTVFEERNFYVYLEEPAFANGIIIKYYTEFWQVINNSSIRLHTECITQKDLHSDDYR